LGATKGTKSTKAKSTKTERSPGPPKAAGLLRRPTRRPLFVALTFVLFVSFVATLFVIFVA